VSDNPKSKSKCLLGELEREKGIEVTTRN